MQSLTRIRGGIGREQAENRIASRRPPGSGCAPSKRSHSARRRRSCLSSCKGRLKPGEVHHPVEAGQQFMVVGHGQQGGPVGVHAVEQQVQAERPEYLPVTAFSMNSRCAQSFAIFHIT